MSKARLNIEMDLSLRVAIATVAKSEKKRISEFVSEWMMTHEAVNKLVKPISLTLKKDN